MRRLLLVVALLLLPSPLLAQSIFGGAGTNPQGRTWVSGTTCPPVAAPTGGTGSIYTCETTGAIYSWSGSAWNAAGGGGGGSGTVTSIATTSPVTGGTITTTGTIACATCGVTGSPLSQFAATTSAQLAGVLSDETGSGAAAFATSPTLVTPAVTTSLTINGGTVTANAPALVVSQTWNNGAVSTFRGATFSCTNSASGGSPRCLDVAIGGTSEFWVDIDTVTSFAQFRQSSNVALNGGGIVTAPTLGIGWTASNLNSLETALYRGAADVIEQRRSTNAQTFNIYAGYTSSSDYSTRLRIAPASGNVALTAESAGATAASNIDIAITPKGSGVVTSAADYKGRHFLGTGTAPAVTNTSANSCGTTAATLAGTDTAGTVTVGATSGTSCTVTFTATYSNAPSCWAIDQTGTPAPLGVVTTTSTAILSGTFGGGDTIRYGCVGF